MKSMCILKALAAMKTSEPILLLSLFIMFTSLGLNSEAACCSSRAHSPLRPRWAICDGTHPSGPVPVTSTLRAPRSYNLCMLHHTCVGYNVCIKDLVK